MITLTWLKLAWLRLRKFALGRMAKWKSLKPSTTARSSLNVMGCFVPKFSVLLRITNVCVANTNASNTVVWPVSVVAWKSLWPRCAVNAWVILTWHHLYRIFGFWNHCPHVWVWFWTWPCVTLNVCCTLKHSWWLNLVWPRSNAAKSWPRMTTTPNPKSTAMNSVLWWVQKAFVNCCKNWMSPLKLKNCVRNSKPPIQKRRLRKLPSV